MYSIQMAVLWLYVISKLLNTRQHKAVSPMHVLNGLAQAGIRRILECIISSIHFRNCSGM